MLERLLAKYLELKSVEEGQTMVEYALVIALMVVLIAGVFTAAGIDLEITQTLGDLVAAFG